jgi:hypothetical protein
MYVLVMILPCALDSFGKILTGTGAKTGFLHVNTYKE